MKVSLSILVVSVLLLAACAKPHSFVHRTSPITLTASGPLTEGSNTAQGEYKPDLAAILQKEGYELAHLDNVVLQSATLSLQDSINSNLLSELTLQLAADNAEMQKVGVLNPIPADATDLKVQVAAQQEAVAQLLKQNMVTVVADVNIKKDSSIDLRANAVLEFLITVKK